LYPISESSSAPAKKIECRSTTDVVELDLTDAGVRVLGNGIDAWMAEARELLKLAGPLVFTQLAQMAIMTTDVIMLSHLSKVALASAGLGNTIFFFAWLIGCGPVAAVAPMIAHTLGASPNARAGVRASVRMGFWSVLMTSVPLVVFLLFTKQVLLLFGQRPELAAGAASFVGALSWGLPFSLGFQVLRGFSMALSRPNASLWVMAAAIAFNAAADYALIFGHFGAPRLGLIGSGLASASSHAFSFGAMTVAVFLMPGLRKYRVFRRFHRAEWDTLWEILRLGMPIGATMMLEAMLFNSATLIMGTFGTVALAAHMVAMNVPAITFMVPLGIGLAATVRVGLAAGAADADALRRAGCTALLTGTGFMSLTALLLWTHATGITRLYFDNAAANEKVIALAAVFLHVAAAFQIFDGLQVVAALSLRGLKDAHAPMWIAAGSYWLAGFPVCLWLAFGLHLKGLGIWIGMAFALFIAATALCTRFWYLTRPARQT
jgi:multidrug resistance protein, MATE family